MVTKELEVLHFPSSPTRLGLGLAPAPEQEGLPPPQPGIGVKPGSGLSSPLGFLLTACPKWKVLISKPHSVAWFSLPLPFLQPLGGYPLKVGGKREGEAEVR